MDAASPFHEHRLYPSLGWLSPSLRLEEMLDRELSQPLAHPKGDGRNLSFQELLVLRELFARTSYRPPSLEFGGWLKAICGRFAIDVDQFRNESYWQIAQAVCERLVVTVDQAREMARTQLAKEMLLAKARGCSHLTQNCLAEAQTLERERVGFNLERGRVRLIAAEAEKRADEFRRIMPCVQFRGEDYAAEEVQLFFESYCAAL